MDPQKATMVTAASVWWSCLWRSFIASFLPITLVHILMALFFTGPGGPMIFYLICTYVLLMVGTCFLSIWALKDALTAQHSGFWVSFTRQNPFTEVDEKDGV